MSLGLGINVKGPRGPLGAGVVRLLDEPFASGATAAYSLRLLREAHVGGLIRSRADDAGTDKGEADVLPRLQPDGSKIIELNSPIENLNSKAQTRLGAPAGGGNKVLADLVDAGGLNFDVFIPTWYGQTPNINDASNSKASQQPQIVDSGSIIKENGKPTLDFDGSDDVLDASFNLPQPFSTISVFSIDVVSRDNSIFGASSSLSGMFQDSGVAPQYFNGGGHGGLTQIDKQELVTHGQQSPNTFFRQNGKDKVIKEDNGNNSISGFSIGETTFRQNGNIKMTELILYDRVNKTEIIEIETNINNFYSIF